MGRKRKEPYKSYAKYLEDMGVKRESIYVYVSNVRRILKEQNMKDFKSIEDAKKKAPLVYPNAFCSKVSPSRATQFHRAWKTFIEFLGVDQDTTKEKVFKKYGIPKSGTRHTGKTFHGNTVLKNETKLYFIPSEELAPRSSDTIALYD
jgi:predicted RND superfamily exporter protein